MVRSAITLLLPKPQMAWTCSRRQLTPCASRARTDDDGGDVARGRTGTGDLDTRGGPKTRLHKLAAIDMPGDEAGWSRAFADVVAQLDGQTLQQRVDELNAKQREEGLDAADKAELRELLQAHGAARG